MQLLQQAPRCGAAMRPRSPLDDLPENLLTKLINILPGRVCLRAPLITLFIEKGIRLIRSRPPLIFLMRPPARVSTTLDALRISRIFVFLPNLEESNRKSRSLLTKVSVFLNSEFLPLCNNKLNCSLIFFILL